MASAAPDSSSPPGSRVTKKRSGAACIHCHRRKVRCDARDVGCPCSNCRSAGKLDCRIHEKKKRPEVRSILNPVPIRCRPPPAPAPEQKTPLQGTATFLPQGLRPDAAVHHRPPAQSDAGSVRERGREMENRLVTLIDEEEPDRREIQRGVRAIYVGDDVSNMSFLLRQQRADDSSEKAYHYAGIEIPRRRLEIGHDQLQQDALTLPEPALVDELVEAYFTHVNPIFPIVEEEHFMMQYRNRDPSDPPPILILQAICLVGAHVSRPQPERDELKATFFRRSKWLFDNRVERNRDVLIQAALLLTWHSDVVDDDVAANAHYWVGVAARIATGLGMHRDLRCEKFTPSERRVWRRVWWILVQFDVLVSLSHGRPQAINLDDCDVQPLTDCDFIGCGPRVQKDFVVQFSELCTLMSYILRERFGLRVSAERRKAVLGEADEVLANWSLRLPESLRLRADNNPSSSAMLHITYNNFLILLHRPHPKATAYSDDYGPHDAEICSAAAGVITSIFEELRQTGRIKHLWYSGVYALFTAMIQVRVELRFSNPVLAVNALRRFDSIKHSLRELAEYWNSAETILRLFENSKRLQRDLQVVYNSINDNNNSADDNAARHPSIATAHLNPESTGNTSAGAPGAAAPTPSPALWPPPPAPAQAPTQTTFPQSAETMYDRPSPDLLNQPTPGADWRQLFPIADSAQPGPMAIEGLPDMEDEWRFLYSQEPSMADILLNGWS